jgi:4-diphosphocytidyl-2-C-methyl-D-erythritol kinase
LAQALGADVPFMTVDEPFALGWGRGDRLLPLAPLPPRPVLLVFPPVAVATRDAYGWLEINAPRPSLLPRGGFTSWSSLERHLGNDFEPAVIARYPQIGDALAGAKQLRDVRQVHMSGSGSTIFALLDLDSAPLPSQGQVAGARALLTSTINHVAAVERVA